MSKATVTCERLGVDVQITLTEDLSLEVFDALRFGQQVGVLDDNEDLIGILVPTDEYEALRRAAGRYQP